MAASSFYCLLTITRGCFLDCGLFLDNVFDKDHFRLQSSPLICHNKRPFVLLHACIIFKYPVGQVLLAIANSQSEVNSCNVFCVQWMLCTNTGHCKEEVHLNTYQIFNSYTLIVHTMCIYECSSNTELANQDKPKPNCDNIK